MLQVMPAPGFQAVPRSGLLQPDTQLLALASELEVAARPYLAYDRDAEVTSADPDYKEALATGQRLFQDVKAVADQIFAQEPQSITGVLVLAHAAALVAEECWDDTTEIVGPDGRYLRFVCNGLFRLAGVDWRGRALPGREPPPAPAFSHDSALIPLAEAAIAEERTATALSEATHHDNPPGTFARSMQLLELVTGMDARTPAGLAAKARVLLTHMPEVDEASYDWRCEALSLSIARDAARLGAAE
ncbi:hypothetical protein MKK75_05645 [Methylobacterium sp. J-030]|uniref:hypothetical protein n=1 Tax=Methylobacterium sp. J-030 TaxID=2836627 RepID=UPI001FBAB28B|nr:hypothetical protein [Methylobacterium sp. J-030]MCJ2068295.1 hypothetical protein [Methylobacterium sp. J-030]